MPAMTLTKMRSLLIERSAAEFDSADARRVARRCPVALNPYLCDSSPASRRCLCAGLQEANTTR